MWMEKKCVGIGKEDRYEKKDKRQQKGAGMGKEEGGKKGGGIRDGVWEEEVQYSKRVPVDKER